MDKKFTEKTSSCEMLKEIVRHVMSNMFEHNQQLGEVKRSGRGMWGGVA